jgi:hypothetical protein
MPPEFEFVAEYAGIADDLPSNLASNFDHYLHGHRLGLDLPTSTEILAS